MLCWQVPSFETTTANVAPQYSANADSNSDTFGPCVNQSELRTSETAKMSIDSMVCFP